MLYSYNIMLLALMRYRSMIFISIFFFYLGCMITLSFMKLECAEAISSINKGDPFKTIEYAVFIISGPNNGSKRDAIRATWAKFVNNIFVENEEKLFKWNHTGVKHVAVQKFIKIYFVIATQNLSQTKIISLTKENNNSNDLLLLNEFEDNYQNLATKMLHGLKWISEHMTGLKYLIKCDDDSFVRVDLIIRDLEAYAPDMNSPNIQQYVSYKEKLPSYKGLYWGYFDGKARVYLNGKWQERNWFLCDHYLPYTLGGGYVISKSIVDYVGRNSDVLSTYISEDVSMGVWTAALNGINRVHDIRFDTEWKSRGCDKQMLVRHKQTPSDMFQMYQSLVSTNGENLCKTETVERKSYVYKWNVLPSMCCSKT